VVVELLISKNPLSKKFEIKFLFLSRGARHGIKMNGKLQRLQEQEDRILLTPFVNPVEKKKKRKSIEIDE